jgi:hypothetical protein
VIGSRNVLRLRMYPALDALLPMLRISTVCRGKSILRFR